MFILGGFLEWGVPQIIHFSGISPYKPSILIHFGDPPFMEPPVFSDLESRSATDLGKNQDWENYGFALYPPNFGSARIYLMGLFRTNK